MKNIMVLCLLLAMSGCGLMGKGNYESHTGARIAFKESDTQRIAAQSEAIRSIAAQPAQTSEAAAFKQALAMMSISQIRPDEYKEAPPLTWEGVVLEGVKQAPLGAAIWAVNSVAKAGIAAAGNTTIGDNATVTDSFIRNESHATGSDTVSSITPKTVDPVVVEPFVVEVPK